MRRVEETTFQFDAPPNTRMNLTARPTYELVKDHYVCEPRGSIEVEGKGELEVWHVIGQA